MLKSIQSLNLYDISKALFIIEGYRCFPNACYDKEEFIRKVLRMSDGKEVDVPFVFINEGTLYSLIEDCYKVVGWYSYEDFKWLLENPRALIKKLSFAVLNNIDEDNFILPDDTCCKNEL